MFIHKLMEIGFTEKEARVYLALLRLGPSPASAIAQRLGIKRVTAYSVLNTLNERGLLSLEEYKNGRLYIPHDPECLLRSFEDQFSSLKSKINLAKNCVENLQNMSASLSRDFKQQVSWYQGLMSVDELLHLKLNNSSNLYVLFLSFGSAESHEVLERFLLEFEEKFPGRAYISVSQSRLKQAQKLWRQSSVLGAPISKSFLGDILIQRDRMIFIDYDQNKIRAICIDDPLYVRFIRDVFLDPIFS